MKLCEDKYFQVYATNFKVEPCKQFELIEYNPQTDQITHSYSESFFMNTGYGFMFVHNGITKIPKKTVDFEIYKTSFEYLPTDNFYELSMFIGGYKHCNPKITNWVYLNLKKFKKFKKSELLNEFVKYQQPIKTFKDWYEFVINNCPYYINYAENIEEALKHEITLNDIAIRYNIKSENEIEIIKWIESKFDDIDQEVKIYDSYAGLMDRVKNECDKQHVKYKIHGNNLKYKSQKNNVYLSIKFSDLNKLGLKFELIDFIS